MLNDRHYQILQFLLGSREVDVKHLTELLGVHATTVRRELREMEKDGLLTRTHGGARLVEPIRYELPYELRAKEQVEAKRKIAKAAKKLIHPKMVIGISGGTTCTELSRQIITYDNLTVITNAVNIAIELRSQGDTRVVMTGGILTSNSYELVGSQVSESMHKYHLDCTFLGASGVDSGFGLSVSDEPEANASRAFISSAEKIIILADHTKIGKTKFAHLCPLDEVNLLITDNGITEEQNLMLSKAGLNIFVAGEEDDPSKFFINRLK